ncbi:hypothetical protein N7492_008464 [Penicillium capsulatum]|uniref:Zn(2)-C6 fungal-type domain-containing protein n=1 Tax=Penicillium capsulatum TaxID=69766 RepID=A0A9W9HTI5_9EURO|nr:hypothetical protein N7492_008464 [Penicillium capsulatum]KAJ6105865.1 hypothetical protein N7512_009382 [Penicillium capsulatum]
MAEHFDVARQARTQGIRCDFPKDVHPYTTLHEDPVDGQDLSSKGSCVSEGTPQDKTGTDYASNPSPVQHLSSVSGDRPQSRAVTPGSVSKEQLGRTVPATGLEMDALSCQAEPRACAGENSPSYGLGPLRSSGSLTGFAPATGTRSNGEMMMAGTVSDLTPATVDINRRRNSTSPPSPVCQDSVEASSVSLHPAETKGREHRPNMVHENSESELKFVSCDARRYVGGKEPLSLTAVPNNEREDPSFSAHQPAYYGQHAGQNEQPQLPDLAVQSSSQISNEEPRNQGLACVAAAVPSTRTDDIPINAEPAPEPEPKKKRAYSRRTRTGCITCRRRKKKCDEHQPLCMWISFTRLRKEGISYPECFANKKPPGGNCVRGNLRCEGYDPRPLRVIAMASANAVSPDLSRRDSVAHDVSPLANPRQRGRLHSTDQSEFRESHRTAISATVC